MTFVNIYFSGKSLLTLHMVNKTKESHAPSAAYWYETSIGGGKKERTGENKRTYGGKMVKCVAYGRNQKNVGRSTYK